VTPTRKAAVICGNIGNIYYRSGENKHALEWKLREYITFFYALGKTAPFTQHVYIELSEVAASPGIVGNFNQWLAAELEKARSPG